MTRSNHRADTNPATTAVPLPRRCLRAWILLAALSAGGAAGGWRDDASRVTLENAALRAQLQGGVLYRLTDRVRGVDLFALDPAALPAQVAPWGPAYGKAVHLDLDACAYEQEAAGDALTSTFRSPAGSTWILQWRMEAGDLVLHVSARTAEPVRHLRVLFPGCDIAGQSLLKVDHYGAAHEVRAPWKGAMGDAAPYSFSTSSVHPLVALFNGERSGWLVEGRDLDLGPANLRVRGRGDTADLIFVRVFAVRTRTPVMFEIRLRAWHGAWQDAVDPYVDWLEHAVGFVPLEQKRAAWAADIRSQAYVNVGDFAGLDELATRLEPARTLIGRMVGYRHHAMDIRWPDYELTDTARRWFRHARDLGFHVGAHVNTNGISKDYPDLIRRFAPGLLLTSIDDAGNPTYYGIPGAHRHVYCSAAYKPWRDYLVAQLEDMVDAGVDLIYLDESMAPNGAFIADGITGIEGLMLLQKQILEAYPHVAIETEQFNPMSLRHASFALTTLPLGHPLSGYIFQRFARVVPEGHYYQPYNQEHLDAFQTWGHFVPGARGEPTWLAIAGAFQRFDLRPASRLPRAAHQLSGFRGAEGVTAFFERHATKRGLVVYRPGAEPRWFGTRHFGIRAWPGPGVLRDYDPGTESFLDWLVFDGSTMLGLDPRRTYVPDAQGTLPADQFHVTAVSDDFNLFFDEDRRIRGQDVGRDGGWWKVIFSGHGTVEMAVPDDEVDVYLDGRPVAIDRNTRSARADVSASPQGPAVLLAVRRTDVPLRGRWDELPWQVPRCQRPYYVSATDRGLATSLGSTAQIAGRFPAAPRLRLTGSYAPRDGGTMQTSGDAVIRVNGQEVLRHPGGPRPFSPHAFDIDVSSFAGRHVLLEFACEGSVHGTSMADWLDPRVVAGGE